MSITYLRETTPVARKPYDCIWCREKIKRGEKHDHQISVFDGNLQDQRWHPECLAAMHRDYAEHHEEEFTPHGFKRGTNEEA
jgi:hypothetical protein